jgi:hypothetical protein
MYFLTLLAVLIGLVPITLCQVYLQVFAVDWNKICLITKSDLTTALGNCLTKLGTMETILGEIVLK